MSDYKKTLLMPQTNFKMKAVLTSKDSLFQKNWEENDVYQTLLERNKNNQRFILHDGPPYANGPIHVGHALNKIIKDIIVRYKLMSGFYSPYKPGWDTHGLPIEVKMLKEMKLNHQALSPLDLRKKARQYALNQISIQKQQFLKLLPINNYNDYYVTLDKDYEAVQIELFKKLALDGLIYKGLKPIYWSPSSQSALAEAEIIYQNHQSPSVYVSFPVFKNSEFINKNDQLIIWTTTPWTLLANSAIAINVDLKYLLVVHNNQRYILASATLERLIKIFKWENYQIIKKFNGRELLNLQYTNPLKKEGVYKIVAGHHVTIEAGSGLVHIAPLFGEEDYIIGKNHDLELIMHINDNGTLNNVTSEYENMFYEKANPLIIDKLTKINKIVSFEWITHSIPHDWRTKQPVIYRATPQWFISISKIKDQIISELDHVKFQQNWVIKRMKLMINQRQDWCISRQRVWGVPITIFYDQNEQPVINAEIFDHIIELFKKFGSNVWFEKTADQLLPSKYQNLGWTKETDIMDVWFDSGVSHLGVDIKDQKPPFELYVEGSDQYRGWFNSSLIVSVANSGQSPYKEFLSHGFVLDKFSKKMSKSLGNIIDPLKIVNKYGADILRLWAANSEIFNDINISEEIVQQNIEVYRKIRGSIRYMLGNLHDFSYLENQIQNLDGVHLLMEERLNNLSYKILKNYKNYNFWKIIKDINAFLISTSSFYFEIAKDSLYTDHKDSIQRRSFQTMIYKILNVILKALAPILPVTTEEAYSQWDTPQKEKSIFLTQFFTQSSESFVNEEKWAEFFELKNWLYKKIEEMKRDKIIGKSNQIKLSLQTNSSFLPTLNLTKLLLIGETSFVNDQTKITIFDGQKCLRCWNYFDSSKIVNDLCPKCNQIMSTFL